MTERILPSWSDGATRSAIIDFVQRVTREGGSDYVAPEQRIAVYDNDGTLWCEKPMPIQLGFLLQRMAAMATDDPSLRDQQPYKAAVEKDFSWLGTAMDKHYRGDDGDVRLLMGAVLKAFGGWTVDDYCASASAYLQSGRHPTLGRDLTACGYAPMVELLRYFEAHGFTNYIASGGDRDFMRTISSEMYGIPPERVIGSSNSLQYVETDDGGSVVYGAEPDMFDDGPTKPVRIWSRVGERPLVAFGNSNGDIPMLDYSDSPARGGLQLLLLHDDADREFDYTAGAEDALKRAADRGWTVVSVKHDWSTVFAGA